MILLYILYKKDLPDSISSMIYALSSKYQWLWSLWIISIAVLLFYPFVSTFGGLGWLTDVCLIGTGIISLIRTDLLKWHYILGIASGILSQICVFFVNMQLLSIWLLALFILCCPFLLPDWKISKLLKGKYVFILEITCIFITMLCLMLQ